nr:lipoprotein-releasing ABC transporter permease subunit [Desulfobacterales bacterium]
MSFEFFVGARYLRAKRKQAFIPIISLISITGVMVGVMALIVVIGVMSGFESDIKEKILGVNSDVILMQYGGKLFNYQGVMEKVNRLKGVVATTPFIYSQVMLRSESGVSGAVLRGIDPKTAVRVINLRTSIRKGSIEALSTNTGENTSEEWIPGIILGKELASTLSVDTGDVVHVITARGILTPLGRIPAMKRFLIVGIFDSGMYEYDASLAYVEIGEAQKILKMGDTVTGIEIRVSDIYKAEEIARTIQDAMGFPYWTKDWMSMNKNLFSALRLEKTVMFVILTLIVLVAAFNIASTLIMMVMEKTKDIAILKAMGATSRSITRIFMFEGLIIGSIGTFLGVLSGLILCGLLKRYKFIHLPSDIYYITTLPVRIDIFEVVIIAGAAILISFLATLYPAWQAAKLDPARALRYE